MIGYAALFGALLEDTLDADKAFEPDDFTSTITPLLSGALGLVLAVSLGVEVKAAGARAGLVDRLKALFKTETLLVVGAVIYLVSGIAGGYVWRKQGDVTPDLVTAVVLTVAGYLVATVTALARQ
jgi:hypothetical protein